MPTKSKYARHNKSVAKDARFSPSKTRLLTSQLSCRFAVVKTFHSPKCNIQAAKRTLIWYFGPNIARLFCTG
jgi:hypothetical protein